MHFPTLLLLVSLTWTSTSGISFLSPLTYFTSGFRSLANYKLGTTARLMSYITGDRAVKASVALKIADKPTIVEPDQELIIEHEVPPTDHVESQILPIPQEVLDKQIEEFKKHFESGYAVLRQANGLPHPQSQTLTISLPLEQYREFVSAGTTGGELMRVAVVTQDVPVHLYSHVPAQPWQHQHSDQESQQQQQQSEQHQGHQQLLQFNQYSHIPEQPWQHQHSDQQQQPEQHQYHQQFLHRYQQQFEHQQQTEQQQEPQSQLQAPPTVSHASADQHQDHPEQTELGEDSQRVLPLPKLPGASSSHSHVFPYGWVAPQVPMPSLEQIPSRLSEFQTGLQQQASQVLQQVPSLVAPNLFPTQQQPGSPAEASGAQDVVIPGSQFPDPQQLEASAGYDVQSQDSASHTTEIFGKPNVHSTQTSGESSDATQESIEASTLRDAETLGPSEERRRRSASDDEPTPTAEPESTEFSNATVADDQVVEEYFQFIRAHDENECLARLICMMSSEPDNFGAYGKQIDSFFRAYNPRSNQQSAAFYKEAASTSRSDENCATRFPRCQMDDDQLKKAVNL